VVGSTVAVGSGGVSVGSGGSGVAVGAMGVAVVIEAAATGVLDAAIDASPSLSPLHAIETRPRMRTVAAKSGFMKCARREVR
jgi:hypothetical protein